MNLRFSLITAIIFLSELIFCQPTWQKINSEMFQKCEDIAITSDGKIYVSLRYKNLVLESKDKGDSWTNITKDTFLYNPIHYTKEFHVDDKGRLIQFLNVGGPFFARFYEENEGFKEIDSIIYQQLLYNTIKHDENGISYTFSGNRIIRYKRNWSETENIIILPVKVVAIFPYTIDINYVLGFDNNKYFIYKFNSSNFTFSEITTLGILQDPEDFYISKQGHVYITSQSGLFFSVKPEDAPKRTQISPKYSSFAGVKNLISTQLNQIIIRTINSCFITYDDGQSWIEIMRFNNDFPSNIEKINALDSSLAIAMVSEDNCGHVGMRIFKPGNNGWTKLKLDYSLWNFSNLFKNTGNRLFAKPDYCSFLFSENEGETWSSLTFDGSELTTVFPLHSKELIGIDFNDNILISSDNGNKFELTNIFSSGINYIGNALNKTQYSLLFFGIKNGSGDFIDTLVVYKYENNNWRLLGGSDLPNPQALRYYFSPTNKLYAYTYSSPGVYVSTNDGLNWEIDTAFKDFKRILDLRVENNGTVLVSGEKYNRETNLFESDGSSNFKPSSSYFEDKLVNIYDKHYPKIIAINIIGGISISDDGGHIWSDFNEGLPIFGKEFVIYNSLYWDEEDYIFASIAYDGLYKTMNKITSVEELKKTNKQVVYPNPFVNRLHIELDSKVNANGAMFKLYTLSGFEIQSSLLEGSRNEIQLQSTLTAGYYLYIIRLPNGNILNGKLVKI
jgi:hypothetical protein